MADKTLGKSKFPFNKEKFVGFLEKYYLNGKIEGARIEIKNNEIITVFKNLSSDLRGYIRMTDFEFEDCEIGCYDTGRLLGMASILDKDVSITVTYDNTGESVISLMMKDAKGKKLNFAASELDIIEWDGKKAKVASYDVIVKMNQEIISDILRANNALDKNPAITFVNKNDKFYIIFGYSQTNSNMIEFELEPDVMDDTFKVMSFPSDYLKEILAINSKRFEEATLSISNKGIMNISFKDGETTSEYWLVKLQD